MNDAAARIGGQEAGRRRAQIIHLDPLGRRDPTAAALIELVVRARSVSRRELLDCGRGPARVSAARQLAMYLMHVCLQRDYATIGRIFDRDRTTVAYACKTIEDQRDDSGDSSFEREVRELEAALACHEFGEQRHGAG